MGLTKADKDWIRSAIERGVTKAVKALPTLEQVGAYDGATPYQDDMDESEYVEMRHHRRIGFTIPAVSDAKQ